MTDAGHDVGGRKRGLPDFGKIILRIAVELEHADLDQRVILVRRYLRKVEGGVPVLADIAVGVRMLVLGCRFGVWIKSGNCSESRTKNIGVWLPTMSQLPSSV